MRIHILYEAAKRPRIDTIFHAPEQPVILEVYKNPETAFRIQKEKSENHDNVYFQYYIVSKEVNEE